MAVWDAGADSFPTYGVKGGYDLNGSTQYFARTSGAIPGVSGGAPSYPLSVVCWFKLDVTNVTQFVWSIDDGSATNRLILYATASALRAYANDSGGASYAQSAAALTAGRWHCAIAVFASASSRAIYVDTDTTGATETTSRSPGSLSAMRVGSAHDASAKVNGVIAYTAILPFDLSGAGQASNRSSIFAGADPEVVTSTTATALYRFDNDNGADAKGSFDLTASGSPTAQNNLIVLRDQVGTYHLRAMTAAPTWSSTAFSNRGGASFASASSQFLRFDGTPPVTAPPFQVYAVATHGNTTANGNVFWLGNTGTGNEGHYLTFGGGVTGDPVRMGAIDGGADAGANTTDAYTASTTHLLWGMEASTSSRTVRRDGASEGTNATSRTVTGVNRIAIGAYFDGSTGNSYLNGLIGSVVLLNTASTTEQADFHTYYETEFGLTLP